MNDIILNNELILQTLTPLFGDAIEKHEESWGILTLTVKKDRFMDFVKYIYNHEVLKMQFLTTLCGAHYPDNKQAPIQAVYHFHNLVNNIRLRLKVNLPEPAKIASLTPIFSSANWQERETYDFYGIIFEGHPNLKRILNIDDLPVFPMRKEYPLEDNTRYDKNDKMFGREANPYFRPLKDGAID